MNANRIVNRAQLNRLILYEIASISDKLQASLQNHRLKYSIVDVTLDEISDPGYYKCHHVSEWICASARVSQVYRLIYYHKRLLDEISASSNQWRRPTAFHYCLLMHISRSILIKIETDLFKDSKDGKRTTKEFGATRIWAIKKSWNIVD